MIPQNVWFSINVVCVLFALIGGGAGLFAFFDYRRNRYFIEFINRHLTNKAFKTALRKRSKNNV